MSENSIKSVASSSSSSLPPCSSSSFSLHAAPTAAAAAATAAAAPDPTWEDEFDGPALDPAAWETPAWLGGWNGEFHYYTGAAPNILVEGGRLVIQPDLTANHLVDGGDGRPLGWARVLGCGRTDPRAAPADRCPVPADRPAFTLGAGACAVPWDPAKCGRTAGLPVVDDGAFLNLTHRTRYSVLPPVTSGLVKTKQAFRFGRLEIRARMPRGDWLWPAIWLVPSDDAYGGWPTSGEIDIVESRGNGRDACGPGQGNWHFGSFAPQGGNRRSCTRTRRRRRPRAGLSPTRSTCTAWSGAPKVCTLTSTTGATLCWL